MSNTPAEPAACAARARRRSATTAGSASLDLDAVFDRIAGLDDEQLQDLVHGLDADLKDCRGGPLDDTAMDLISVAAAARIALRRRRAAAGRRQATHRIHQLTSGGAA